VRWPMKLRLELFVSDVSRSLCFYREALGFVVDRVDELPCGTLSYASASCEEAQMGPSGRCVDGGHRPLVRVAPARRAGRPRR
jgi:hypothetical protein